MLNFALIGCGRIAKRHCELLGNELIVGTRLAAVRDVQPNRAKITGRLSAFPISPILTRRCERIDDVSVLTLSGYHAENVVALVPYGKHIVDGADTGKC